MRLSSYIDDTLTVMTDLRASLVLAVKLTYEFYSYGFTLNEKCSLCPSQRFVYLGLLVDTINNTFRLPEQRALRLTVQAKELAAATSVFRMVPARQVAQFIGLLWSASPCCPRMVGILTRGMIEVLATDMRFRVYNPVFRRSTVSWYPDGHNQVSQSPSLKGVLVRFWSGDIN